MATTAKKLLEKAASQIGVKESPPGSNIVKYWTWYKEKTGLNLQGAPWCAAFVTWCLGTLGQWKVTKDEGRFRYCPSLVNWGKEKKEWIDRSKTPKPGDIVLFANKGVACHVGFVEKVLSGGRLQTIEGNTSLTSNDNGGAVMRRTRELGAVGTNWYVLGYVRPKYKSYDTYKATSDTYTYSRRWFTKRYRVKKISKGATVSIVSTWQGKKYLWGKTVSGNWVNLTKKFKKV